jgi:KaiB-like protein
MTSAMELLSPSTMEQPVAPQSNTEAWLSFYPPLKVDEIAGDLEGWLAARRPRRPDVPSSAAAPATDGNGTGASSEPVELILYVSSHSPHCAAAIRTVKKVLSRFERSKVRLTVRDLREDPTGGIEDNVAFTPTLVRRSPTPRTFILGHMSNPNLLLDLLAECED